MADTWSELNKCMSIFRTTLICFSFCSPFSLPLFHFLSLHNDTSSFFPLTFRLQVERSKALLASLGDERERWNAGSETFKSQMSTISGDVLLTSAFMAYGGYFDQQFRQSLFSSWASHMQQANISFRGDLARVEVSEGGEGRGGREGGRWRELGRGEREEGPGKC